MNPLFFILGLMGVVLIAVFNTQYVNAKNLAEAERHKRRRSVPPLIGLGALLTFLSAALGFGFGTNGIAGAQKSFGLEFAPVQTQTHVLEQVPEANEANEANIFAFSYPKNNEQLDAQDFLLEGRGKAGTEVEILQNGISLGKTTVNYDGTWSWTVSKPKPGNYDFQARVAGSDSINLAVNVGLNRSDASNAKCPCSLRIETKSPLAIIRLFRDGVAVERIDSSNGPVKVFRNLEKASYSVQVDAPKFKIYKSANAKFSTPKNKNIKVYLDPEKQ